MLGSAEVMHLVARRAADFGVEVSGAVRFNMAIAVKRTNGIVRGVIDSIYGALDRRRSEISFLRGAARFVGDHEIDTGDGRVSFANAIIATGARNSIPQVPGLAKVDHLTNRSALALEDVPSSIIVIGGGYIGIEFAQMYARFGSRVTLLGRNAHLAPGEDPELADLLAGYLREEGIDVRLASPVTAVRMEDREKVVVAEIDGRATEFRASEILVATGRRANTDGLDLDAAGIERTEKGAISVDDKLLTSQAHVAAIGDVKGGWMFTHVATYDAPIAALNLVKQAGKRVDYRVVPRAIFSSPTLAAVGLTEAEARAQGREVLVGSSGLHVRAKAIGDTRGKLKAVVDARTREILGFHILAPHGDDLLHEVVAAMYDRGAAERITKSIHVHPTLSESVKAAAKAAR